MSEIKGASSDSLYPLKFQPLLGLSASFLIGVFAGNFFSTRGALWFGVGIGLVGIILILLYHTQTWLKLRRQNWQETFPLTPGWFILLFALGMLRFASMEPTFTQNDLAFYNDRGKTEMIAVITQPANVKSSSTTLTVKAESILPFWGSANTPIDVNGKIRLTTLDTGEFNYGDRLRIICEPETPQNFSNFNYQRYLAARKIYTTCDYAFVEKIDENAGNPVLAMIYSLRKYAQNMINQILPPDEAALLSGIFLGNEDHIAPEVETAFQRTGTSHIIAISGANFTVLISFITLLFLRHLPKRWVIPVSLLLIAFYTIMVGGNAAVIRAAIMGGLSVFGSYFGRRNQGLNTLAFSGALFVLVNPYILWDLGFQLSFFATLGLVLFSEKWTKAIEKKLKQFFPEKFAERFTALLSEYVLMTLAAQIFTLPLIAYTFQQVSLASFVINILILPVQPMIMALGGLATVIGLIHPFAGKVLGWVVWIPLTYTIKMVSWGSSWSWSSITIPQISTAAIWIYFIVVGAYPLLSGWVPKIKKKLTKGYLLTACSTLVLLLWTAALQRPVEDFRLYLFPLEDSSAVLFQFPDSKAVLMGRSENIDSLNHELEKVQPGYQLSVFLQPEARGRSFNRIDDLTTHFPFTDCFIHPQVDASQITQFSAQIPAEANLHTLTGGQIIQLTTTAHLHTLAVRDGTAAFLLEYQNLRILIPNSIPHAVLQQIAPEALKDTTVLILNPHQLDAAALHTWTEHPAQLILSNGGVPYCDSCITTTQSGRIELRSDGVGLWLSGME